MMPLREKLKRAFKTSSPASSKSSSPTIPPPSANSDYTRWPSNVYRPDEPMPPPKYRAPVKKEHKEKLESFNFGNSWRRRSRQSMHSPGGSRACSRRSSRVSRQSFSGQSGSGIGRESMDLRRKSIVNGNTSRSNSISTANIQPATDRRRMKHNLRVAHAKQLEPVEAELSPDDIKLAETLLPRLPDQPEEDGPAISVDPATPYSMPSQQSLSDKQQQQQQQQQERGSISYFPITAVTLESQNALARIGSHGSDGHSHREDMLSDRDYDDYYFNYSPPISHDSHHTDTNKPLVITAAAVVNANPYPSPLAPTPRPGKSEPHPASKLFRGGELLTTFSALVTTDDELAGALAQSTVGPPAMPALRRTSSGVLPGLTVAAVRA